MRRLGLAALALAFGTVPGGSALADPPADSPPGAMPARTEMTPDGPILVTPAGMTLYAYANENTNADKFRWQCTNTLPRIMTDTQTSIGERPLTGQALQKACAQKGPPYAAGPADQPVGDFGIVERPEKTRQWTYKGLPLYTSVKDRRPGDRNGTGGYVNGIGFVTDGRESGGFRLITIRTGLPKSITFMRRGEEMVLATAGNERPVYTPRGKGSGLEENLFEPMLAPQIATLSGDWSTVDAGAGRKQYAFRGKPLYMAPPSMSDLEIAETGKWDVVPFSKSTGVPREIDRHMTLTGEVYTDRAGRTLYVYGCAAGSLGGPANKLGVACDDAGDPAGYMVAVCGDSASCAQRWSPYLAPANARPVGDWSVVDITYPMFTDPHGALYPSDAPRVKVWAYRGRPVFRFQDDKKPGDIWGDMTKGLWGSYFVVARVPGQGAIF
jgi:predicted lipoprotein with Yx(FWY)xxD motif